MWDPGEHKMMILMHYDWAGTIEELDKLCEIWKKHAEKTDGVEWKGRLVPWNKKYHFTNVMVVDDITRLYAYQSTMESNRDYSKLTHAIYDFYQ